MTIQIIQIILSAAIITLIMLQQRGSGIGNFLGGGDGGGSLYQTRRGLERIIFVSTIVLTITFLALALYQFFK
jgi:protein translocase SecG subunit